jgi:hypothetical protein
MMHRVMNLSVIGAVVVAGSGCPREKRLFDAEITLFEAEAVSGVVDDGDVSILTRLFADGDEVNGGAEREQVIDVGVEGRPSVNDDTADVRFEIEARADDFVTILALGSSAALPVPEVGETLAIDVLLAPPAPGLLTLTPLPLGGDACMADNGRGDIFLVGGALSTQGVYVLDETFFARGFSSEFPTGVADVGCAAGVNEDGEGVVAVVGGCSLNGSGTMAVITAGGDRRDVDVSAIVDDNCGAAAAPRSDGRFWVVSADNAIHHVNRAGSALSASAPRAGIRRGLEVTQKNGLVTIIDEVLVYAADDVTTDLGPAIALGRRGADVLVLDADGQISAVEDATTRPIGVEVAVSAFAHFVVLDDDTFVGLAADGASVTVVNSDGDARVEATVSGGHTRVSALVGGAVVISGSPAAGMEVMAAPRTR